jgi:hypothetical protein
VKLQTGISIYDKGHLITALTMRGGQKMSVFVHAQGIITVHVVVECPHRQKRANVIKDGPLPLGMNEVARQML